MTDKPKMNSSELGALWMTYHKKTLILRMLEYFIEKAKNLMSDLWKQLHKKVIEMKSMFENEVQWFQKGSPKKM